MNIVIIAVVAVVLVLVVGLLIFRLMKRAQTAVPEAADARAGRPQVVGTDAQGRPIMDGDEPQAAPRDETSFESLLQDEIDDLGMKQPPADDEG